MKQEIHPTYYPNAKIRCACGKEWHIGSTTENSTVGICSDCHPFYTGQGKIVDTRGRVERFMKRREESLKKRRPKKV